MQEDFLHFVWQYQKFTSTLKTVKGDSIKVLAVGQANTDAGPDFFNARLVINQQEWAGNIEIHLKSSDWYAHYHETDKAYHNVILHVVWEDDVLVFDKFNQPIPTLELKNIVDEGLLSRYKNLLENKSWINCENQIKEVDQLIRDNLKDVLLVNRLEQKSKEIVLLLKEYNNDWESVLFLLLAKNFGLHKNALSFYEIAKSISFLVIKKEFSSVFSVEALLFGQANLLNDDIEDSYYIALRKEYEYLKHKYQLQKWLGNVHFFRMRPASFPTIRLSQLAQLYVRHKKMWSVLLESELVSEIKKILKVEASEYWKSHYTFGKVSPKRKKVLSDSFIELLIINVIIPLKYVYAKNLVKSDSLKVLQLYKEIKPEKNSIIYKFKTLGLAVKDAGDSQALLYLKKYYCSLNKCLQCKIGNKLLYA